MHTERGACVAKGACVVKGCVCGEGDMHGKKGGVRGMHAPFSCWCFFLLLTVGAPVESSPPPRHIG